MSSFVKLLCRYYKRLQEGEKTCWTCEDCCAWIMIELRELSRKSLRLEDRWIKKSNYKAIIKPSITEIKESCLENFQLRSLMGHSNN